MNSTFKDIKIYSQGDFPAYLPKLNNLYDDLFTGGKGFRARLVRLIAEKIGVDDRGVDLLCQTIEFIHNASLLHDDLVDRSNLRRNKTTAWLKYTPEYAVLAGDYLLARVMVNLSSSGNIELVQYTSQVISDLLEGEWIQDSLVRDWNIELKQLDRVHELKTASLFNWCLRAPFIYMGWNDEEIHNHLKDMGSLLGKLFQRSDDLLDFDIRNDEGKIVLGDLKSGYLNSFSVFLCSEMDKEKKAKFIGCNSMSDIYEAIGRSVFERKAHEFDELNLQLIDLYQHNLVQVNALLVEKNINLDEVLKSLSDLLYWRRAS